MGKATILRLVRIALRVVMFFLILGLLVALAQPETGVMEKVALGLGVIALLSLARPVHRIG